jgi:hypothetical protein
MCDEDILDVTDEEFDLWREYTRGFEGYCILGVREVLTELDVGPVKILDPTVKIEKREDIKFTEIRTYREWYDLLTPRLDFWIGKVEPLRKTFASRQMDRG